MKSKASVFAQILFLLILISGSIVAQKRKMLDSAAFQSWPTLLDPHISPNGKYIVYAVANKPVNKYSVTVKALNGGIDTTIACCEYNNFSTDINDERVVFSKAVDTLAIFDFKRGLKLIPGSANFKAGWEQGQKTGFIAMNIKGQLHVLNEKDYSRHVFSDILFYEFVDGGRGLLIHSKSQSGPGASEELRIVDLVNFSQKELWSGKEAGGFVFSDNKDHAAFIGDDDNGKPQVIYCDFRNKRAVKTVQSDAAVYASKIISFNAESNLIAVELKYFEEDIRKKQPFDLRIWKYADGKVPSDIMTAYEQPRILGSVDVQTGRLTVVGKRRDGLNFVFGERKWHEKVLIGEFAGDCTITEDRWSGACRKSWYVLNMRSGNRQFLPDISTRSMLNDYYFSPDETNIVFYDNDSLTYYNYHVKNKSMIEITAGNLRSGNNFMPPAYMPNYQRGIAGWGKEAVYIYWGNDIVKFEPGKSKPAINLTQPYGSKNNIQFSFMKSGKYVDEREDHMLSALNKSTKENGFYRLNLSGHKKLQELSMKPVIFSLPFDGAGSSGMRPVKASQTDIYIVRQERADAFPNFYATKDFRSFMQISQVYPEKEYKWLNTELHTWKKQDGVNLQGVLYKPDNFDSTKKYPLIITVYERQSNSLNAYIPPAPLCNGCVVNPAAMTQEGYLVFKPDILYRMNEPGASAQEAVESAIDNLAQYSWVDTTRVGLQGCSFGGFESNYILTHSSKIRAICSASGVSNYMSFAGVLYKQTYGIFNFGQLKVNKMPWEDINPIIENSAIVSVNKTIAPVLLFHTSVDEAVPFNQGVELFLALRKLRKKAWLLEYPDGNHGVFIPEQNLDFGRKMTQFFNHYLKDQPMPDWMKPSQENK